MHFKLILLLALCCYEASALKCYNCSGLSEKNCNDPFNSKGINILEVGDGYVCTKTKSKGVVLFRMPESKHDADQSKSSKDVDFVSCKKNLCNNAPQLITSATIILSMAYAVLELY